MSITTTIKKSYGYDEVNNYIKKWLRDNTQRTIECYEPYFNGIESRFRKEILDHIRKTNEMPMYYLRQFSWEDLAEQ